MKNVILLLSVLTATSAAYAQIPNGGFENWTVQGSYSSPDNWGNLNAMTNPMATYTCMKGTPGTVGTSYIKLVSKTVTGIGVVPGIAATGTINMSTMSVTGGFANSTRPANLTGSWQHMGYNGDQGIVGAYLTKWNSTTMKRDTVATAVQTLTGMAMSWATFSIPFAYSKGFNPDTAMIILSSSGTTPVDNSYLYVDNLAFAGSVAPTSIGGSVINPAVAVNIYPNPANQSGMFISFPQKSMAIYAGSVCDMTGRKVSVINCDGNSGTIPVSLTGLPHGLYVVELSTSNGKVTKRFSIR